VQVLDRPVEKKDIRQMQRLLRQGWPVWYVPDQSYRCKHSALVPFFGEPAMTSTPLSEVARLGRAKVVPYLPRRLENGCGYSVEILPALENFPSGDAGADAKRVNQLLEGHIRGAPEQYYWVHRRFKGRPSLVHPYVERLPTSR
jgi:KDO2-lipid IV(A) lauroyltransferase